jgi:flagellar basal body-associated protein FliL
MTKPTNRKNRSKLTMLIVAPILSLVFMAGWSLYWIGQSGNQNTKQLQKPISKSLSKQDEVELIVIPQQEEQIIAS